MNSKKIINLIFAASFGGNSNKMLIGKNGGLPWKRLKKDMKFFKDIT